MLVKMVTFVGPDLNFTVRITEASVDLSFDLDSEVGAVSMSFGSQVSDAVHLDMSIDGEG